MSDKLIRVQIFQTGSYQNWAICGPGVLPYDSISADWEPIAEEWFVPYLSGGVFDQYKAQYATSAPTTDSVRTVRLRHKQNGGTINILGALSEYTDLVNACCGTTGTMTQASVPDVLVVEELCGEVTLTPSNTTYPYSASAPSPILAGQKITLSGNANGTAFTPAAPAAGFATRDAALTWAQSNWSQYGTFSAVGANGIKLQGINKNGGFSISLIDVAYCMPVVASTTFNQVKNGDRTFDLGQTYTVTDAQSVVDKIKSYLADGTVSVVASKVNYLGKNKPVGILLNGATVASFSVGACA